MKGVQYRYSKYVTMDGTLFRNILASVTGFVYSPYALESCVFNHPERVFFLSKKGLVILYLNIFRYECIDNDLLGPLRRQIHIIAPYRSKGVEKAEELPGNDSMDDGMINGNHFL